MHTRIVIVLIAVVVCLTATQAAKRQYGQFMDLDPSNAEQTMASLASRPRINASQWTSMIESKADRTYIVQEGENLWGISKRELGNPYLWRKLWETNPFLTNPHEIEKGTRLSFLNLSNEGVRRPASDQEWAIPLVKLSPTKAPRELESTSVLERVVKNRSRPLFYVIDDGNFIGKIAGSYSPQRAFALMDSVYLRFKSTANISVGTRLAAVKRAGKLRNLEDTGDKTLGILVRFLADLRVTEIGENYVKAEFTSMFNPVTRGDEIIPAQAPIDWSLHKLPPANMRAKIIMGEQAERHWFSQGDMVVLNKGGADGMQSGYIFRAYIDRDPYSKSQDTVDAFHKGEVQVVQVSRYASVGYVVRNTDMLKIGDFLVPANAFSEPLALPTREQNTVEIP